MTEIDAGLRVTAAVAGAAGIVGPMVWYVFRKYYILIMAVVFSLISVAAIAGAIWADYVGLEIAYDGKPPTFRNLFTYFLSHFGTVFLGLSLCLWIATRFLKAHR